MKIRLFQIVCLFLLTLLILPSADAQFRSKYGKRKRKSKNISKYHGGSVGGRFRPYEYAGFNINALNYFGDLAPVNKAASTDVSFTRPGFGFNFGYKFNSQMALRAGLNWGRLQASDYSADPSDPDSKTRFDRNLSFRNDIYELQLGFEVYLFPNYGGPNVRLPFNAYLFAGVAMFYHSPKGQVPKYDYQADTTGSVRAPSAGEWVALRPLGTEGQNLDKYNKRPYSPIQLSIPLGIGARMRIPGTPFDVGLEMGYRMLFTDYIDDVSDTYVELTDFDDPLARIMSDRSAEAVNISDGTPRDLDRITAHTYEDGSVYYRHIDNGTGIEGGRRGNPKDNDMYFVTSIKLTYVLGSRIKQGGKFR